jgi:DNA-binding winged helix-turn-helix (wHTH) protein/TolB-like protein/tetratricopeptide (TPR) repeat protein
MELDAALRMGFRLGDWEVRPIEGLVGNAKESRHLQPKTMDVLVSLAAANGQVMTRDELLSRVWGANAVSDEPLTRCIHELRRCLDDDRGEPTYIQTIPKRGYRLLTGVSELRPVEVPVMTGTEENPLRQVSRQRVLWVGLIYASLAWLFVKLLEQAETRASIEQASPEWLLPALVITLLLGFPIAVFFAWFKQLQFEHTVPENGDAGALRNMLNLLWSRRGLDTVLVTLVISLLAGFALDIFPSSDNESVALVKHRVAVLPFTGRNGGGPDNWLGKGVAEDVHGHLRAAKTLAVSSISVSFRDTIQLMEPQQLGHELNAEYVLRGLVIRGDDTIRIKAYLFDTVTGLEVWSRFYSRDAAELFTIQADVSREVLAFFGLDTTESDARDPERINMPAYESYLRGRDKLRTATTVESAASAALWFQHALAIDEHMAVARNGLCRAYVLELELELSAAAGIYGKANSACAEAILQGPESLQAHLAIADFYRVSGHAPDAVKEYQWVVNSQPDNAQAWFGLAQAILQTGSAGDAEQAFRRVLELRPDCADAHEAFTAFLLAEGRYAEALREARYLVRLDSDRVSGYEHLAEALFMNAQFAAAIKASREVLSRDLERYVAVKTIGQSYYYMGRYQNAINIFGQAVKVRPEDHALQGGLANAYAQLESEDAVRGAQQSFARARFLAERSLLIEPGDANTTIDLAYYCAALDDQACTQQNLNEALRLAPDNVRVHYIAALTHARSGDIQAATIAVQRALTLGYPQALITIDPLLASAWSERGYAYSRFSALFVTDY